MRPSPRSAYSARQPGWQGTAAPPSPRGRVRAWEHHGRVRRAEPRPMRALRPASCSSSSCLRTASYASASPEFLHEPPTRVRPVGLWLNLERLYSGQFDSFEVFERRAATGRNMCEARRPWLMSYRRRSVAASEHARDAVEARDRLADLERALRERRDLEEAQRPVPDHGFRAGQPLDEFGDRPRSDIEAHLVGRNVIYDICRRLGFRSGCDDVVAGQHERDVAARRLPHQLTGKLELVLLEARLADARSIGLEKRVGHRAADQQRIDFGEQISYDADFIRYLGAAQDRDVGMRRVFGNGAQRVELANHQEARGALREELRHADG